ncbi:Deoxyribonuclease-2-alpha [Trichinella spiralis]|uniref:Deoxyribonuclease-2-alpha n=1 Tax=Trichinella spiralis TaxID=6334 RepID=A0A0V1B6W7_TRISP|nr:Deoxyribonuclease-2-alpha [Trichinella spiralis]
MYITIILILISLNCCTAQVATCRDDANNNVDCTNPQYFKPPNVVSSSIMKSEGNPAWAASAQTIDQAAVHSIFRTMASFVAEHMDIKVLAYSDNPPNLLPQNEKSKAKGVLLVDNTGNDAAAWFVHTVPKFLAHLGGYSWPAAETAKGHMFLCLSLSKAHLNLVAKAIRYQEPFIYANNLSPELLNQHVELSNLITGAQIRVTPFLEHAKFTTKAAAGAAANIQAFGKHTKSHSDMYAKVLKNKLAANIRIWAPSDTRSKSICKGQYQLRKIASPMQLAGSQVSREADSAKWALVEQKNTVCLTTNDYTITEKRIPGAAVCLENADVYNAFRTAAMMLTTIIVIFISLKSCTAQVATCKDDNDFDVNPRWSNSAASIDVTPGQSIARTMVHYVQNDPQIKVLAYNDDPPNIPAKNRKSKAKGVLLIDKRQNDAAAWFVHTVPNFLAHLGGKAIRYQEPYIYANNLPADILNQHKELSNLVNGVEIRVTPFLEHARFVTKNAQVQANIQAFGKHSKSFADIYGRVLRNKLSGNIRIWAPSDAKSKSICKGQYKLQKIDSPIQFADNQVSREADSARWALVEGKNTVCLTTNDYKNSEKKVPGAAVCIENANVYNAFSQAASNVLPCNK